MIILGIETSCDETAASVVEGRGEGVLVLSNIVSSQIDIHKKYGGVIPEVAAREHVLNIIPVINESIITAKLIKMKLGKSENDKSNPNYKLPITNYQTIDAIAVTIGPGLITSLIAGIETAKTLAMAWNIPIIAVNHIEGHIYANFIIHETHNTQHKTPKFPTLILTVSGGHTMLVLMKGHGRFETIGETRDDAAGEAFDKAAQMLGIGYPGGPAIANLASQISHHKSRIKKSDTSYEMRDARYEMREIALPRPMINSSNFDFSFSGLKTALLYELKKDKNWKKRIPEYASDFQQAVIDVLIAKTIKAAKKFDVKNIMLSGGVAANQELRRQMAYAVKIQIPNSNFQIPDMQYTTDNAAMIATAGYFKAKMKKYTPWQKIKVDCNLSL